MLHTLKIVLAVLLMTLGAAAYADPPGRVARLNQISGTVSFAPADAPDEWTQAVLNRPLTGGDRLWADNTGRAELHTGATAIRLNALTNVDILNLDDQTLQLRLAQGSINLRVRDLAPNETLEIATPAGAVLLRQPGSYRVSTDPQDGTARVLVNFGQAEVVTPGQNITVPSGQVAVVSPQSGISFEVAAYASVDEFDRWSADRDRREDNVPSTRYVSRDMTGYEDLDQYGAWRTLPEYGAVWVPTRVAPGWAPYRHGHWTWVSPWGWTWVDDAPWGFAPFHYGRWVHTGGYWAWAPGAVVRRPVYAPALVAFVGGSNLSVSVASGPAVGWFPLGYREPFRPWYRASETHVRNINVTNVTNVTNITYVNRNPQAVTIVPQQAFVSARPVAQASVRVVQADLARADVAQARPPAEPIRASFASERAGSRPPQQAIAREVVATTPPPKPAAQPGVAAQDRGVNAAQHGDGEPRVRVIGRERFEGRAAERSQQQPTQAAPAVQAPAAAGTSPPTGFTRAPETTPARAGPRPPGEERRAVERTTAGAAATTPAIAAPRPESAREMLAPRTERSAVRPDERGPVSRAEPRQPQPDARPAVTPSEARPASRIEERRGPRAEHRPAPVPEIGPVSRPDPRPAVQAEVRPAPRPEAARPVPPAARTEERRAPAPAEPPRARPAPPPGQGATRAAAPQHEVRFSERPVAAPRAAQLPQQRPAEAPRASAPQPHKVRQPHAAQP